MQIIFLIQGAQILSAAKELGQLSKLKVSEQSFSTVLRVWLFLSALCGLLLVAGSHGRGGEEPVAPAVRRHGRRSGHHQGQFHPWIWFGEEPER